MKNFKKLFASLAIVAMLATAVPTTVLGAATYSEELEGAYDYAYDNGITTMSSIENADMYGSLTRIAMAKMMANYAVEVLGQTPDTTKECSFPDVTSALDEQYDNGVTKACQLGLMGVDITAFNPNGVVTRAQFGTVLSRALYGETYNGGNPYYVDHLQALKDAGIMNNISNPNAPEVRGYVMLMMQRADEGAETPAICETPENVLACSLGLDTCPAQCQTTEVREGTLSVSLKSAGNGGDITNSISALPVVTYKFAASEDINITSLTLKQVGFGSDDTITNVALFIGGKRVSTPRDVNLNTDRVINLSKAYTVKGGSSVDIEVRATLGTGGQFAIKLVDVNSSAADLDLASNLTSATYKIVDTIAATLAFTDKTAVEYPKVGSSDADIFEFVLSNNISASKQDVKLYEVTLMASGSEARNVEDYLSNLKLIVDGNTISTAKMDGKYVTFNIANGYLIEKDKTPTFTVKADVIGGAAKVIDFTVDNEMDIRAVGQTHNTETVITKNDNKNSAVTIQAGKVTIERKNPTTLQFVGNRKNILLGSFDIINNAGGSIRLEDFELEFSSTGLPLIDVLDSVKVKFGSTTAGAIELDRNSAHTGWTSDTEMNIGSKLTVYVYADIANTGMSNTTFYMALKNGSVVIRETENDQSLTSGDISYPTRWATMQGREGELTLTKVFLPDETYSKGTTDIEALSFKLKAGSVYGAKVKKLTFTTDNLVNSNTVRSATLYRGTTAIPATVSNGQIRVTTPITINANETANFLLKVDLASNPTVTGGFIYSLLGTGIEAEDTSSDRNTITVSTAISGREIKVTSVGTVAVTYEANATVNKNAKLILAGSSAIIAEYNIKAEYEQSRAGKIEIVFNKNVADSLGDLELSYSGNVIASDPTWNIAGTGATFSNVNLDLLTEEVVLSVKAISTTINSNGGHSLKDAKITKISLIDVLGKDSGNEISMGTILSADSQEFDITPVTITASVKEILSTSATIALTVDRGSNQTGSAQAKATLDALTFNVPGNNGGLTSFRVEKEDGTVVGNYSSTGLVSSFTGFELGNGENLLKIYFTQSGSINTPSYTVRLSGVSFKNNVDANPYSNRMATALTVINK